MLYSQKVATIIQEDHLEEYDPAIVRMNTKGTPIISMGSAAFLTVAFPSRGKGSPLLEHSETCKKVVKFGGFAPCLI